MRHFFMASLAVLLLIVSAAPVRADGFISGFAGYDFGGDSGCATSDCQEKRLNSGVSFGYLRPVFGFEEEIAYAKNFFGETPGLDSSVLTAMTNVMLAPNLPVFRPYALVGMGLVKTRVKFTPSSVVSTTNNHVGWDAGVGLMVFFGDRVGIRGDVRHIHAFQDLDILDFYLDGTKLNFSRVSGGIVVKF